MRGTFHTVLVNPQSFIITLVSYQRKRKLFPSIYIIFFLVLWAWSGALWLADIFTKVSSCFQNCCSICDIIGLQQVYGSPVTAVEIQEVAFHSLMISRIQINLKRKVTDLSNSLPKRSLTSLSSAVNFPNRYGHGKFL